MRRSISIVVLAFISFARPASGQSAADSAFQRGDFVVAAAAYEQIVARDTSNGAAWFGLAASDQATGNLTRAREALGHARALNYRPVAVRYRLARIYAREGKSAQAIAMLDTAAVMAGGGFTKQQVDAEKDFDSIRNDPALTKLLDRLVAMRYPCRSMPEAHQFDFWIGQWDVTPWSGIVAGPPGFNDVHAILESCVVFENWRAGGGGEGKSFNYYDTNLSKWRQVWRDDAGSSLDYTGEFRDGAMRFTGWTLNAQGKRVEQKLTFTPYGKDTVRQTFEASNDGGKTWSVTFDGRYVRRK
ncbi:MAG TPA: tetratricopeptide repeat protein [Gemmatimonadaceae bacterium]|nr:tetratricopeptide repeat protein [Gemmatimonadaceae bacterium]